MRFISQQSMEGVRNSIARNAGNTLLSATNASVMINRSARSAMSAMSRIGSRPMGSVICAVRRYQIKSSLIEYIQVNASAQPNASMTLISGGKLDVLSVGAMHNITLVIAVTTTSAQPVR